jgi:hypothetical protein
MPYITKASREQMDVGLLAFGQEVTLKVGHLTPGELNYVISRILAAWINNSPISYESINAAIGVLECAKLELYRRLAVPYEEKKFARNGDLPEYEHIGE